MKSLITTLIATLIIITVSAQARIENDQITYKKEQVPALLLQMEIPTDNSKDLFKEFMHDRYDSSVKGLGFLANKDNVQVKKAELIAFNINPINLVARFSDVANGNTTLKLTAMDMQKRFITEQSNAADYAALTELLKEFNDYAIKTYVANEVEKFTDELKDKEKDLKNAEEDINDHQKDIEKKQKEITEHKREVEDLRSESKTLSERISELNNSIKAARAKLKNAR